MDSAKIAYERIEGHENVVRIPLANINDADFVFGVLQDTFTACFQNKDTYFVVDLEDLVDFPPSLLALLIEATAKARSFGGDVKIVNLSQETKNRIDAFSVGNYLSIKNEEDALKEFLKLDTIENDIESEADKHSDI